MLQRVTALCATVVVLLGMVKDHRPTGVGLPESSISALASTNERVRDAAISQLLRDGLMRLEEIEHASETLQEVLRMHRRLTTPHIDWRAGHRMPDEQVREAANYFLKFDAIPWLLEGLKNQDLTTRWIVATTLARMSSEAKEQYRQLVVERTTRLLTDTFAQTGDATMDEDMRFHLAVLTAELIGEPIPERKREGTDWNRRGAEVGTRAEVWLSDQQLREQK